MTSTYDSLLTLLTSLKRQSICIEIEGRIYRGDLVYVGLPESPRQSFITMKDVLHGNVRIPFRNIRQVWYRNRIVWNYITKRAIDQRYTHPFVAQVISRSDKLA